MSARPLLLLIAGPTAGGKTALAVALAEKLGGAPIISTDSRQFYRELNVGVARPSEEELSRAKHYFIADRSVETPLTAGSYAEEAGQLLEGLFQQHPVVIAVGGSGLYIRALAEGFDTLPEVPEELKETLRHMEPEDQLALLLRRDPEAVTQVATDNPRRVQRALELVLASGKPLSELRKGSGKPSSFEVLGFGIDPGREQLYERIEQRTAKMIREGLKEEASAVKHLADLPALQTVGYTEMFAHLEGKADLQTTQNLIAMNTRRYAKRQYTWFRNQMELEWMNPEDLSAATDLILQRISAQHGI
ncbi:MAG: tRNA (adenosine(37)-N6)-dimethylallyltransferase MiaA [Bacteroidetes bacterium]|nr:tRNA (adenosine(37)-N6)-dimethylallyltransferase MiaA [Bacteroidota bacterium]